MKRERTQEMAERENTHCGHTQLRKCRQLSLIKHVEQFAGSAFAGREHRKTLGVWEQYVDHSALK